MLRSKSHAPCKSALNSSQSRTSPRSLTRVRSTSLTKRELCSSSISGQPGAVLAKVPWVTTKKCSRRTASDGEERSESSVSQSTRMPRLSRTVSNRESGTQSNTITLEMVSAPVTKTGASVVSRTPPSSTPRERSSSSDIPRPAKIWSKTSMTSSKVRRLQSEEEVEMTMKTAASRATSTAQT